MKTQVFESYNTFKQRVDKKINGVSTQFAKKYPNWEKMNITNTGCWNCVECEDCNKCEECKECQMCVECVECEKLIGEFWKLHNTKSVNKGKKIKKEELLKIYFQYQKFAIEKKKFLYKKEWIRLIWFGVWIILYIIFFKSYIKETNLDVVWFWGILILNIVINIFVIEMILKWGFTKKKRDLEKKKFELKKDFGKLIDINYNN